MKDLATIQYKFFNRSRRSTRGKTQARQQLHKKLQRTMVLRKELATALCILILFTVVRYSESAPLDYECSEEGLTQLVLHPSYLTYISEATKATIDCDAGLDSDPEFVCDWEEPSDICNNDIGGKFVVFIKRITCPDGSSFTLYPNCVPDSCNISEARELLEDTFLSNLNSGCNGEVTVLYGVVNDIPGGGSSQPSVAPAPTSGKGSNKENVLTFIAGKLVLLNLLFA